jgi:hypothetical protein
VSQGEKTKELTLAVEPDLERSFLADIKVPPMIQKALERHRRDLPELMKRHANQWVAYRGEERLELVPKPFPCPKTLALTRSSRPVFDVSSTPIKGCPDFDSEM